MKTFKTTGLCNPTKNYMVDITKRLEAIKVMIDNGDYFTINRARQFGKTTTLAALERYLSNEYIVMRLDFQAISTKDFTDEESFVRILSRLILKKSKRIEIPQCILDSFNEFIERDI